MGKETENSGIWCNVSKVSTFLLCGPYSLLTHSKLEHFNHIFILLVAGFGSISNSKGWSIPKHSITLLLIFFAERKSKYLLISFELLCNF